MSPRFSPGNYLKSAPMRSVICADWLAAASEAVHVACWSRKEVRDVFDIRMKPIDNDPLVAIYGCTPRAPWAAAIACDRFLSALELLIHQPRS